MGFLNFGSRIKNRSFDYIPRHYDPEKEKIQQRVQRYDSSEHDPELAKARIRGGFRKNYRATDQYSTKTKQRSNKILFGTIIMLLLLTYLFLSEHLPNIVKSFE